MHNYGVPDDMLRDLVAAEKRVAEIQKKISDAALANLDVKPGEIMKNIYTGLHYQVSGFSAYVSMGERVKISVNARRYYKSGRREGRTAYSNSFINFEDLERAE